MLRLRLRLRLFVPNPPLFFVRHLLFLHFLTRASIMLFPYVPRVLLLLAHELSYVVLLELLVAR